MTIVTLMCINFINFATVYAVDANPKLQFNGVYGVEGNYFIFKNQSNVTVGKAGVRLNNSETYLSITANMVNLPATTVGDSVIIDFIPETGYEVNGSIFVGGSSINLPGAESNGPISFDSKTLPSIEFGIGSGVTIEFGGAQ